MTDAVTLVIRKLAHMTEYAVLAVLAARLAELYALRRPWLWAILFVLLYAAGDEVHQYLGGSRTGQWQDVLIDGIGGAMALWLRGKCRRPS